MALDNTLWSGRVVEPDDDPSTRARRAQRPDRIRRTRCRCSADRARRRHAREKALALSGQVHRRLEQVGGRVLEELRDLGEPTRCVTRRSTDRRRWRGTRGRRARGAARGGRRRAGSAPRSEGDRCRPRARCRARVRRRGRPPLPRTRSTASRQASSLPAASMTTSAPSPSLSAAPKAGRARGARVARLPRPRARLVLGRSAEHEADRAEPEHGDRLSASISARSTPCRQQASGSTIAATCAGSASGTGHVPLGDALRHETYSAYAPFRNGRFSQSVSSPRTQARQAPHGAELAATTRRPVATSIPANSWPNGLGVSARSSGWPRLNVLHQSRP